MITIEPLGPISPEREQKIRDLIVEAMHALGVPCVVTLDRPEVHGQRVVIT